ncbi:MAG: rod shape-determining protein MreC [Desulfatibacillaceae bacterium]
MFSKKMATTVILIVISIIALIFFSVPARIDPVTRPLSGTVLNLTAPPQEGTSGVLGFFVSVWRSYFDLVNVSRENARLRIELDELRADRLACSEALRENARLRDLLGFARTMAGEGIAARVVADDPSHWYASLIMDRGLSDGVGQGSPVVTPRGVVGKVVASSYGHSKVLLIVDPNSAVDARVVRTRARGIVEGGAGDDCRFKYVLRKEDVKVGDLVITSGLDRVYPPGLPIGRVSRVSRGNRGMFQEVAVTPHVNFDKLEEVLVIVELPEIPPLDQP